MKLRIEEGNTKDAEALLLFASFVLFVLVVVGQTGGASTASGS